MPILQAKPVAVRREESAAHEIRCGCGSLLARRLPSGLELKCRRCRRHISITLAADGSLLVAGDLLEPQALP